jgi:hypothetical protein
VGLRALPFPVAVVLSPSEARAKDLLEAGARTGWLEPLTSLRAGLCGRASLCSLKREGSMMSRTFRPTLRAWLSGAIAPLLLFAGLGLVFFLLGSLWRAIVLAGAGGLVTLVLALPLLRTWVRVDDAVLSFRQGRHIHVVPWAEVLAAAMVQDAQRRWILVLGTATGECQVRLQHLDRDAIWRLVQERMPPAALPEDAFMQLPWYRQGVAQREQLLAEAVFPLRVSGIPPWLKGALVFGTLLFLWFAFLMLLPGLGLAAIACTAPFISLAAACALPLLLSGSVELDAAALTRRTLWGQYAMRWEDVRWVEQDREGYSLVFHGGGKQLSLTGPAMWWGKDKARLLEVLNAQIQQRGLEVCHSWRAAFRVSRNVRMRRPGPGEPPQP